MERFNAGCLASAAFQNLSVTSAFAFPSVDSPGRLRADGALIHHHTEADRHIGRSSVAEVGLASRLAAVMSMKAGTEGDVCSEVLGQGCDGYVPRRHPVVLS
jgi:hypothetical protein